MSKKLPDDLEKFRDSYVEMFGTLPPLPAARFEFSGEVNPEFLRVSEQLRRGAFYSDVLDMKTTQLILFGMLLAEHNTVGAAGSRRGGAQGRCELGGVAHGDAARRRDRRAVGGQQRRRVAQDVARQGAGGQVMMISRRAALAAAFALITLPAAAAEYPAPKQGDWIAKDFRFHTGDVMPELRLHYTTIGVPTGEPCRSCMAPGDLPPGS